MACIHDNVNIVEDILKNVVDVNATDHAGWTALHEACNHGNLECVKKILEYHGKQWRMVLFIHIVLRTQARIGTSNLN